MGMPADNAEKLCGYKSLSEEIASFSKVNGRDNECFYDGYGKYTKAIEAYLKARKKYPLGAEIADMRG